MKYEELEFLLRGVRDQPVEAPPFRRVWGRALERRRARRPRRRAARAVALVSAAALVAIVWLVVPRSDPASGPGFDREAEELARALSSLGGPLDFLLEPPGGHLVGLDPLEPALRVPTELSTVGIEEVLR